MELDSIKKLVESITSAKADTAKMKKEFSTTVSKTEKTIPQLEKESQLFDTVVERVTK